MVKVKLVRRYAQEGGPAFNVGEGIALPDALAASLISRGIAVRAYDTPPVDRMVATAPTTHDLPPRKGRVHVK